MLQATPGELWHEVEETARTVPGWVAFLPDDAALAPDQELPIVSPAPAPAPPDPTAFLPAALQPVAKQFSGKSCWLCFCAGLLAASIPLAVWLSHSKVEER